MDLFDRTLHILINTFVVFPLRTASPAGYQINKSKEMFWSFFIFSMEIIVMNIITTVLLFNEIEKYETLLDVPRQLSLLNFYLLPVGPLSLVLFYDFSHLWRKLNMKRERSHCLGFWFDHFGIKEEGDAEDVLELDLLNLYHHDHKQETRDGLKFSHSVRNMEDNSEIDDCLQRANSI